MEARDAPRSRRILQKYGQRWTEKSLGSLTLMVVEKATEADNYLSHTPLFLTEQGCFAEDEPRTLKQRADLVYRHALKNQLKPGESIMEAMAKVLALYDGYQPARTALAAFTQGAEKKAESALPKEISYHQTVPAISGGISFPAGLRFLGITLSTNVAVSGQGFDITYFWKCPPSVKYRIPAFW